MELLWIFIVVVGFGFIPLLVKSYNKGKENHFVSKQDE